MDGGIRRLLSLNPTTGFVVLLLGLWLLLGCDKNIAGPEEPPPTCKIGLNYFVEMSSQILILIFKAIKLPHVWYIDSKRFLILCLTLNFDA